MGAVSQQGDRERGGGVQGFLAVTDEPLVSVDFRCSDVSTTIDASLTMVLGDDLVKVVAWYGEWSPLPQRPTSAMCAPRNSALQVATKQPHSPQPTAMRVCKCPS